MTCQAFGKKSAKAKATQLIVLFESFLVFLLFEQRQSSHGSIDDMETSSRWVESGVSRHLKTLRNINSCVNIEVCPVCPLFFRDDFLLISITGYKLHSARQKVPPQNRGEFPGEFILKGWQHVARGRAQRTPPVSR